MPALMPCIRAGTKRMGIANGARLPGQRRRRWAIEEKAAIVAENCTTWVFAEVAPPLVSRSRAIADTAAQGDR